MVKGINWKPNLLQGLLVLLNIHELRGSDQNRIIFIFSLHLDFILGLE